MELMECILNRRSIRSFTEGCVSDDEIKQMITAAIAAPSWKNSQTARFYVTASKEKTRAFCTDCLPEFNQNSTANACAYVVMTAVSGRSGFERDGSFSTHLKDGWQYFDNGIAAENFCLKAYEMGYGTLIMGIYDNEGIRKFFSIPDTEVVCAVIAVGKAAVHPEMPKRKTVDEVAAFVK